MDIKKNDDIKLNIEAMTSEGSAVGHYNGVAVFVRGAVPGDIIIAHIIKTSKRYCIGIIRDFCNKSPSRIKSDCPVSEKCGGCSFRNMTYSEELKYKKSRVEDAVKRIAHLDIPVKDVIGADEINRYRNKAQYPVIIEDGELFAGFYAYKSHRIIPCKSCLLQSAVFEKCLDAFSKWVKSSGVDSYDESKGKGLLRHIYLRKAAATGELTACAVINGESLPDKETLIGELKKIDGVKSVCVNINKENSNVILGEKTVTLWGSDTITDILLGKRFVISPNSFYQVNHDQCERLYSKAAEYAALTGGETVVDLYCGAGTIGLTMADKAKAVFGIEIVPQAVENAKINAGLNGIKNAEFFCGDAEDGAKELEKRGVTPDVIILDPPRKGCSRELLDTVARLDAKRIVYVSCDSATLARDLEILNPLGYNAVEITPVDMFPRTPHVEAVAKIMKRNLKEEK
ncbi:MAG: 23S rRNA (uracil(1939)-C(5))-methyltransferase RlmD [Eubacterium sp.]|nr:23S rRNA (uracil(1939)-C(5))-methyltransferase RlmD [Eubacterium sp.]